MIVGTVSLKRSLKNMTERESICRTISAEIYVFSLPTVAFLVSMFTSLASIVPIKASCFSTLYTEEPLAVILPSMLFLLAKNFLSPMLF